jgi:hypothetical protein
MIINHPDTQCLGGAVLGLFWVLTGPPSGVKLEFVIPVSTPSRRGPLVRAEISSVCDSA